MGTASRVTPGRLHNDSLAASLPIENSPPGIHTMPSGFGFGAGILLETVGAKGELPVAPPFVWLAEVVADSGAERNIKQAVTAAMTIAPVTSQRIAPGCGAAVGFGPADLFFILGPLPATQ